jgi:hypothetical protein
MCGLWVGDCEFQFPRLLDAGTFSCCHPSTTNVKDPCPPKFQGMRGFPPSIRICTLFYFMLRIAHSASFQKDESRFLFQNFYIPQELIETEIYMRFERERSRLEGKKPVFKLLVWDSRVCTKIRRN